MLKEEMKARVEQTKCMVEGQQETLRENLAAEVAQIRKEQPSAVRLRQLRERIQRSGRLLGAFCRAMEIFLTASILFMVIMLVGCYFSDFFLKVAQGMNERNSFYRALQMIPGLSEMEPIFQALIGCFIGILSNCALLIFVRSTKGMAKRLAEDGKPFSITAARKMRKTALVMLIMMLYNVPLGIISAGMVMVFSYLIEYGGYIQERADETNRIQEEIIVSFAEITENKSGQTGQHIRRVSEYARILAQQMGMSPEEVENIRIASTMHDVGKLMIPTEILEKPGKLTDEEYAIIKTHTTYGGELLKNVEGEEMALSRIIALQHHERADGKGYPAHLAGEQISLEGRIVAVADVYDALTSRRSYKEAWKEEDAYQEILRGKGTQFDPKVVDAFEAAHDQIKEIQHRFAD